MQIARSAAEKQADRPIFLIFSFAKREPSIDNQLASSNVTVPPFLLFFFSLDGSSMESQLESAGFFYHLARA
jgi:hypothetical protein